MDSKIFSKNFLEFSRICEKLFTYKLVNVATKSVPMYVDTEGSGAYKAQIGKIGRFDGARISTTWKKQGILMEGEPISTTWKKQGILMGPVQAPLPKQGIRCIAFENFWKKGLSFSPFFQKFSKMFLKFTVMNFFLDCYFWLYFSVFQNKKA